ncbi:MarR family winged helix-turn-helix transcriptional regulator [Patulibacter sp. S7RM1-6]
MTETSVGAVGRRRLPSRTQLGVWREYLETADALRVRLAARLQDETGLSFGDYAVLLALAEAPDHRYRSSALADRMGWQRSRLSHHLGRMERRGLIRREACAADSRGAEVVLAAAGGEAFRRASIPHLRAVRELFLDALTAEQLEQIAALSSTLRAHLERDGGPDGPGRR